MIKAIFVTFKKLISDKRGDDFTETSSSLSRAGRATIAAVAIVGVGAGTVATLNNTNTTTDNASNKVGEQMGGKGAKSETVTKPFSQGAN